MNVTGKGIGLTSDTGPVGIGLGLTNGKGPVGIRTGHPIRTLFSALISASYTA